MKRKRKPIMTIRGLGKIYLQVAQYEYGDRLYLGLLESNGEYFADISINIPDIHFDSPDTIFVSGDLGEELRKKLEKIGLIKESICFIPYNMGSYELVTINFEIIKEFARDDYESLKLDSWLKQQNIKKEDNQIFEKNIEINDRDFMFKDIEDEEEL